MLPGIIGSLQANEVIKVAARVGEALAGRLFLFDAASFSTRVLKIPKNPSIKIESLEALQEYCAAPKQDYREIDVVQYQSWLDTKVEHVLIDVREAHEYEVHEMGGILLPLSSIKDQVTQIPKDKKVLIHCKSGGRSVQAIRLLQKEYGFENLYNLKGGILAWERAGN